MDLSWILLALFLVAIIRGVCKALSRSMLKNILRLGSVIVAFLITFGLQLGGVFQNAVAQVVGLLNLAAQLPALATASDLIAALASTFVGPFIFVIVFLLLLWILRVIIHFVVKIIDNAAAKKAAAAPAEAPAEAPVEAPAEAPVEATVEATAEAPVEATAEASVEASACENPEENAEITSAAEENAEQPEATADPVAEEPAPAPAAEEKPKKKRRFPYNECGWKRAISIATGVVSGLLLLGVLLMPSFYLMDVAESITTAASETDAEDSQIYQVLEVLDEHLVAPYRSSFVVSFYDTVGVSDLLNYTTRAGGKILLTDGKTAYADDVIKGIASNLISAAAQITSPTSDCATVGENINEIISDPVVSTILTDVVMTLIADVEMEEPAEDDIMGGLIATFVDYYKNADRETISEDLQSIGDVVGVLAEKGIIVKLAGGNVDFATILEDGETLGDVVEAISGLSAFGPTLEGAFELGVEILGDTLQIPANDAEAYDIFIEDLLDQMVKDNSTKFDLATIQYYIYHTERLGLKATSGNGVKGYAQFSAYVAHWEKVQSAFAHASEDRSYGYFTMVINGNTYVYDSKDKVIVIYDESNADIVAKYKDKVSPIPGLINALALRSTGSRLTRDNLYTILTAYAGSSSTDTASLALANRMLDKDNFVSNAVTVDKMLAATNFSDWTDEEKAKDSRLCVDIIMSLLGIVDTMGNLNGEGGAAAAIDFIDQFGVLGKTMDTMQQTSCINQLPPLLIEGIVKNEMLSQYMKPSIAFKINDIVESNENTTYEYAMNQIAGVIRVAISMSGTEVK